MNLKTFTGLAAGAILLVFAIEALFVVGGLAAERCGAGTVAVSWYGRESCDPRRPCRMATGEHFDGSGLTAASRTLPFGTKLRLTYRGRSVVVRINDRGPWVKGRALDLSATAATRLAMKSAGVACVRIEPL